MARDSIVGSVFTQGLSRGAGFALPAASAAARRQLLAGRAAVAARQHVLNNAPQKARAVQRAAGNKIVSLFSSPDMVAAKDLVSQSKAARDAAKLRFSKSTAAAQKAWDEAKAARELVKGTFAGTQKSKSALGSAIRSLNASGGAKTARALSRMPQAVRGSEAALKTVMADYQASRDVLAAALRGQRSARDTMTLASGNLREAQALFGETRAAALKSANGIASAARTHARNILSKVPGRAAKHAPTTVQRVLMAADDSVGAVSRASGTVRRFASNVNSKYNPFFSGSVGKATKVAEEASKKGLIRKAAGWVSGKVTSPLRIPTAVEGFVAKRAVSGNVGARLARSLTAAKSNALGFAVGSWVDAGLNAYDYFTDSNNKVGPGEITINGRTAKLHEPGVWDAFTSGKYWAEVGKGVGRALTLGFWGSGDDTVLDRLVEANEPSEEELTSMIDAGRDPYTGKYLVDSEGNALVTDPGKNSRIIKDADKARTEHVSRLTYGADESVTEAAFRDHLGKLVAEKSAKLQMVEDNVANWENFSKTLNGRPMTADHYRESATKNFTKRYDGYIAAAMSNPVAKSVADANRVQAYRLYTGRDFDRDYAAEGAKAGSVEGFREFTESWDSISDLDRTAWNYEEERRAFEAGRAAGEKEGA